MQAAVCSLTLMAWLLNTGVAGANLTGQNIYHLEASARKETLKTYSTGYQEKNQNKTLIL